MSEGFVAWVVFAAFAVAVAMGADEPDPYTMQQHQGGQAMTAWMADAACVHTDPDSFFPNGNATPDAAVVRVCAGCPVREECLSYALARPWLAGVWGGLGAGQRQLLRRGKQTAAYYLPRACAWCGEEFAVAHGLQKFCGKSCANKSQAFARGRTRTGPPARSR